MTHLLVTLLAASAAAFGLALLSAVAGFGGGALLLPVFTALDNAVAESFTSTLEWELLRPRHFTTREQARRAVAAFIDEYNTERRHSANGMLSPLAYEHQHAAQHDDKPKAPPDRSVA